MDFSTSSSFSASKTGQSDSCKHKSELPSQRLRTLTKKEKIDLFENVKCLLEQYDAVDNSDQPTEE